MTDAASGSIRLLIVARHPFRVEDLGGVEHRPEVEDVVLIRRPDALEAALDEHRPDVLLIDTGLKRRTGHTVIQDARDLAPDAAILALTASPPHHDEVALAARAGAAGFIDVDAEPAEFADALRAARRGQAWFPPAETRDVLDSLAGELETTSAQRRSRLTGMVVAFIPLAGIIAALLSRMWRGYLGQIGVRPVDIAVDPTSRVVDVVFAMLLVIGVFGPLLFVGSWLELLRQSRANRGLLAGLFRHSVAARAILSILWLGIAAFLAMGVDLALTLLIGPVVTVAMLARVLDLSDELPRFLRMERLTPSRALIAGAAALIIFIGVIAAETYVVGPDLRRDGAHGWIAPRVLGFKAQPMRVFDLEDGAAPRDALYLGGNADLYVLVDPCEDDDVEFVSVGRHRLEVIDEVSCERGP
mgnify:CR=1 FL=1